MNLIQKIQVADMLAHCLIKKGLKKGSKLAREVREETAEEIRRAKNNIQNNQSFVSPQSYAKLEQQAQKVQKSAKKTKDAIINWIA